MPSLITHHVFSEELLDILDNKTKDTINKSHSIYNAFAQSHDYLFYCKTTKNRKHINSLGHKAHKNKTQEYLINLINNIKELELTTNPEALCYLYGSITHYVLDSTCHPYIFYKTGAWNRDDLSTYKYRGEHTHIEKDLDAIYYFKHYNRMYKKCNVCKEIIKDPEFTPELCKLVDKTYKDTYDEDNISYYYQKGIKDYKLFATIICQDRFGIKKIFYKLFEILTFKLTGRASSYSTHLKLNYKFLNKEHKKWTNPVNPKIVSTKSFEDLYDDCLEKSKTIIEGCNKYLNGRLSLAKLKELIPNLSYSNGLLLEDYAPMRYFEK